MILKLTLTTLWMSGIAFDLTMGGLIHVLALAVLVLVFIEGTPLERKLIRHAQ